MARNSLISFRPTDATQQWLEGRARRMPTAPSLSLAAAQELGLWRAALAVELRRMPWTVAELCLIADAMNGHAMDPGLGSTVAVYLRDVFEAYPGSYGSKWEADEPAVLRKASALGPVADHALADAMARFWDDPDLDAMDPATWSGLGCKVVAL